jgi:hypothetical protein
LAVEYADTGQDEAELKLKISELLAAGTQLVWVVRLEGPRRVEVHEPGRGMYRVQGHEELTAPGILRNPVPVAALYDREAAHRVTFRNLLQRQGYNDVEEIREEGREEGCEALRNSVLNVLETRGLTVTDEVRARLADCHDLGLLQQWLTRAVVVTKAGEIFSS